jgi:hypothetical protein
MPSVKGAPSTPQVSGRLAYRPRAGIVLGVSAARGKFVSRSVMDTIGAASQSGSGDQRALGFDAEFSHGDWLVRTEGVWSSWQIPSIAAPLIVSRLGAFGIDVEGRYRIRPGLYAAARLDRLDFSDVTGTAGTMPWDAPVRRIEVGGGYSLQRNMLVKVAYQYNWRNNPASYDHAAGLLSAQLQFWF